MIRILMKVSGTYSPEKDLPGAYMHSESDI